jgi:hypothetical protein
MKKIKNHIEEKFDFDVEYKEEDNKILIRVNGIDNTSLSKWIGEEFDDVRIDTKDTINKNKYSDKDWITIEKI